jgi:hypothetical protein
LNELVSVRYVGCHTAVVFSHAGRGYEVAHGDVVDVPADLAASLLDGRSDFEDAAGPVSLVKTDPE